MNKNKIYSKSTSETVGSYGTQLIFVMQGVGHIHKGLICMVYNCVALTHYEDVAYYTFAFACSACRDRDSTITQVDHLWTL